jgi:hypothetical protein
MKLRAHLAILTALFVLPTIRAQSPSPTPTVDELVAKNIEAKGGAAAYARNVPRQGISRKTLPGGSL